MSQLRIAEHAGRASPVRDCVPARMIGREMELRALLDALTRPPALVLVEGEAGIGKSALVRAALAAPACHGRRVLAGHCHRLRDPFSFGPIVEALCALADDPPAVALGPVAGALRPILPELTELLPTQPPPIGDSRAERHRIFRAMRELLASLGPTVCVLEDLHWADESTLELLEFLTADHPPDLSLVVTMRAHESSPGSPLGALAESLPSDFTYAAIRVPALSIGEVAQLACALLETEVMSDELAEHLHRQTGGIPFALEEIVRMHRDRLELVDDWQTVEELADLAVPPAVRQSLRERMSSLATDAGLAARAAAVLAAPAPEELIRKVAGLPAARAMKGLGDALSAAVLEENTPGEYGFIHALAAQAVYDEIPGPERRWLHRRAARALEAGPAPLPLAQLAHHFHEAGQARQWAHYVEAAADAAVAIGDDRAAARLLEQGLRGTGPSCAARVRIARKLGQAAIYSAHPETAIELLELMLADEHVPATARGELRYHLARLHYQTGNTGPWRDELRRAIDELHDQPALAARAMLSLAWPVVGQGPVGEDLAWLQRAVAAARRSDDRAVQSLVDGQRAAILQCVGDRRAARLADALPRRGQSVEEDLQLLRVYQSLTGTATGIGRFERAESFLAVTSRLAEALPHISWQPWLDSARASLDWRTGRWDGLEHRLGTLTERESGGPGLAIANEMLLASLLLAHGHVQEAERRFASIGERAKVRGWMGALIASATGLARIGLARGHARAAVDAAACGLEILERKQLWIWGRELVPVAVQALLACGDQAAAEALGERFSAAVRGRDAPAAMAAALFCEGTAAAARRRHDDAASAFALARSLSARLPAPYEAATARAARARCLHAAGNDDGACELRAALDELERLGCSWDATRIRGELRSLGIALPSSWRGGRKAYGDELSPREVEIARLAGMGQKNREIAATLFISPRTVETHVAAALRKLSVRSREELAGALAQLAEVKDP